MILYYSPGTCSLAVHIALTEAGMQFDKVKVDLQAKRTEQGKNFLDINPKGYVPTLVLEDNTTLSEMVSTLYWIATTGKSQDLPLLDMLAFLSTEVHKYFLVAFFGPNKESSEFAQDKIIKRYEWLGARLNGGHLFGDTLSVADIYLYVTTRWSRSEKLNITRPDSLEDFCTRVAARPAVRAALAAEGLAE